MAKRQFIQIGVTGLDTTRRSFERWTVEATREAVFVLDYETQVVGATLATRSSEGPLYQKSGQLKRRWAEEVKGDTIDKLRGAVYTPVPYAAIHETGGVISAPGRGWLFIPTLFNVKDRNAAGSITALTSVKKALSDGGKFERAGLVDPFYKNQMEIVTPNMVVNNIGIPLFTMVKSARYEAVLGVQAEGARASTRLLKRLADAAVTPFKEQP